MTKRSASAAAKTAAAACGGAKSARTTTESAKSGGATVEESKSGTPSATGSDRARRVASYAAAVAARGNLSSRLQMSNADAILRVEAAVKRYRELLESAGVTERTLLMRAVTPDGTSSGELDESLWGPAPTEAEAAAAEIDQLMLQFERRRAVATSALTREAAAELLKVSKQAVLDHLQHGDLVGLREGKRWLLPLWQFEADSERGFLPGIAAVQQAFPGGVVSLSRWITRANPDFAERPPREAMAAGDAGKVADAAKALAAAGW